MNIFKKIGEKIADFFRKLIEKCKKNIPFAISLSVFLIALIVFICIVVKDQMQIKRIYEANNSFKDVMKNAELSKTPTPTATATNTPTLSPTVSAENPSVTPEVNASPTPTSTPTPTNTPSPTPSPAMTASGQAAYELNNDYVGWLEILGSYKKGSTSEKNRVDHPVFQTFDDPSTPYDPNDPSTNEGWYYLERDANKQKNSFGSLFVDEVCTIGKGTKENNYENGTKPSANIIIYGHNWVNYIMFGSLKQYWTDSNFYEAHKSFTFTTCYETREYEIIAYYDEVIPTDDSYFFASFVNCTSQEQMDTWAEFLRKRSSRKITFTAELGDEFVTLVTCATASTDSPKRKVVVGKRIK